MASPSLTLQIEHPSLNWVHSGELAIISRRVILSRDLEVASSAAAEATSGMPRRRSGSGSWVLMASLLEQAHIARFAGFAGKPVVSPQGSG